MMARKVNYKGERLEIKDCLKHGEFIADDEDSSCPSCEEQAPCDACGGLGYLEISIEDANPGRNKVLISRCDACEKYSDDLEAASIGSPGMILAVLCRQAPGCKRCGSTLNRKGYCVDTGCPHSDYQQDEIWTED